MLSVVVQAGGESRRMGQDKGLVSFLGQPLIERVVQRLAPIADELLVTTNRPDAYRFLNLPLYPDLIPGRGALGGLYTALSAATHPQVIVVACDMPFVSIDLLNAQVEMLVQAGADALVPHLGEGVEPFHAVYVRASCLPLIQAAIEANKWRADAWFSQAKVVLMRREKILEFDPQLLSFSNVNTPEELQAAEDLASRL